MPPTRIAILPGFDNSTKQKRQVNLRRMDILSETIRIYGIAVKLNFLRQPRQTEFVAIGKELGHGVAMSQVFIKKQCNVMMAVPSHLATPGH